MKGLTLIFFCLIINSTFSQKKDRTNKTILINYNKITLFEITTPTNWFHNKNYSKKIGRHSYIGEIKTDDFSLIFDFGPIGYTSYKAITDEQKSEFIFEKDLTTNGYSRFIIYPKNNSDKKLYKLNLYDTKSKLVLSMEGENTKEELHNEIVSALKSVRILIE